MTPIKVGQIRHDPHEEITYVITESLGNAHYSIFVIQGTKAFKTFEKCDLPVESLINDEIIDGTY